MRASELDYELPTELIAQEPAPEREASRLLYLHGGSGELGDHHVRELPRLLPPSLVVLNDTKVIPARLFLHKASGGRVEFLLIERLSPPSDEERWLALGQTRKGLRVGMELWSAPRELGARIEALHGGGELELCLRASGSVSAALERRGQIPLPPYIRRPPEARDAARYQTVFAAHEGAVAAPTAGLHMSDALLSELRACGHELAFVTLHVGPGTFAPLRSEELAAHTMHEERYVVPESTALAFARARREGRPVLAVGTTVVRTLEASLSDSGELVPGARATSIFIHPPYRFRAVDSLLTNFHLPRSTLLALVMAFGGVEPVRRAYEHAVGRRYRFFSYGDAMLITGGGR